MASPPEGSECLSRHLRNISAMRAAAASSVLSSPFTAKKASGPKIARTACIGFVPSSSGEKIATQPERRRAFATLISSCGRKSVGPANCTFQPSSNSVRSKSSATRGRPISHTAAEGWPTRRMRSCFVARPECTGATRRPRRWPGINGALDDSGGHRGVGVLIDQDEAARGAVLAVGIEEKRQSRLQVQHGDVVHFQAGGRRFFQRVHVDPVQQLASRARARCAWCALADKSCARPAGRGASTRSSPEVPFPPRVAAHRPPARLRG